jgi:NADH-quinone oxidoreductase subunit D
MPQLEMIKAPVEEIQHLVSNRAIEGETLLLNMGPQHPSTHGVLRLLLELDGEIIINCIPDVGYLHTGIEKNMEAKRYQQAEVMTDRLDYLNTMGNNLAYVLAVEKLVDLDVPERAQVVRVIMTELQRIASHLVWLGTGSLDLAAMTVFLYCFRDREVILDILEMVSGQRMMTTYFRPGGLWRDTVPGFEDAVRDFLKILPHRLKEYEALLSKNPIFIDRTKGIGLVPKEKVLEWGITGPIARGSGINYDLRKAQPYSGYDTYDFEVPVQQGADVYDRYLVRMEEMRQSLRIIEQGIKKLKKLEGKPFCSDNRKFVPPPRAELGHSMEAVIHHFKLWTEGFNAPKGSVYVPVESPRGELGVYLEGDGGPKPYRVHFRTPSFSNLQILSWMAKGYFVADLVAMIGSIDIVLGDIDR